MLMPTISQLRNKTGLLAIDALTSMRKRLREFATTNPVFENWEMALDAFLMPVCFEDFLVFAGMRFIKDGREFEVIEPNNYEYENGVKRKKGSFPQCAHAPSEARFGGWSGQRSPNYPIDADLRIWFKCKAVGDKEYHVPSFNFSYNELSGRCSSGRILHWCEKGGGVEYKNSSLAETNRDNWILADPLYRKTPEGQPKVDEILKPGTLIHMSYQPDGKNYIVEKVSGPYIYQPKERPEDHVFETYSISMIDADSKRGGFSCNELVAVNGRIQKLFYANEDEVFILGSGYATVSIPNTEDDDELDEECVARDTQQPAKRIQLSLF